MDVALVRDDLLQEQMALDTIVSDLSEEQWSLPTPSPRWSIADQIGHLTYFDESATVAITNPDKFSSLLHELLETQDANSAEDFSLAAYREMNAEELLSSWRQGRENLALASETLSNDDRVMWYGPSMGSKSFLTARLMEVWAHGQDILDTLSIERTSTDRLRHIAQLGFITRKWAYINRGLTPNEEPIYVSLTSPSGEKWEFGSPEDSNSITGSALDFCLVVTQRRHMNDTELTFSGEAAVEWFSIAQAFAGPPSDGPKEST
tara:strand:- start:4291 stop:5079 length:789 start_codon:yes stop_codon:yes gene_type:complete